MVARSRWAGVVVAGVGRWSSAGSRGGRARWSSGPPVDGARRRTTRPAARRGMGRVRRRRPAIGAMPAVGSVGRRVAADVAAGLARRRPRRGCRGRAGRPTGSGPPAQARSRSTDSPAVTATGTMFCAASTSGTSSSAASRQHALISAPVQSRSAGRRWPGSRPNLLEVHPPDRLLLGRPGQVEEEHRVEPLGPRELRRQPARCRWRCRRRTRRSRGR